MTYDKFDKTCPFIKFEFWDASVSLDIRHGNYECHTKCRGYQPSQNGDDKWRYVCDSENHKECYYFKKESKLEENLK